MVNITTCQCCIILSHFNNDTEYSVIPTRKKDKEKTGKQKKVIKLQTLLHNPTLQKSSASFKEKNNQPNKDKLTATKSSLSQCS